MADGGVGDPSGAEGRGLVIGTAVVALLVVAAVGAYVVRSTRSDSTSAPTHTLGGGASSTVGPTGTTGPGSGLSTVPPASSSGGGSGSGGQDFLIDLQDLCAGQITAVRGAPAYVPGPGRHPAYAMALDVRGDWVTMSGIDYDTGGVTDGTTQLMGCARVTSSTKTGKTCKGYPAGQVVELADAEWDVQLRAASTGANVASNHFSAKSDGTCPKFVPGSDGAPLVIPAAPQPELSAWLASFSGG